MRGKSGLPYLLFGLLSTETYFSEDCLRYEVTE
jgi:hypothetical protein